MKPAVTVIVGLLLACALSAASGVAYEPPRQTVDADGAPLTGRLLVEFFMDDDGAVRLLVRGRQAGPPGAHTPRVTVSCSPAKCRN